MSPPSKQKTEEDEEVRGKLFLNGFNSGVIRFEVDNVSTLDEKGRRSPEIEVSGTPWYALVAKKTTKADLKVLGVFLHNCTDQSAPFIINVDADYIVVHSDTSKNVQSKLPVVIQNDNVDLCFGVGVIVWEKLIDEKQGFIKDDKITVEIRFSITNMRGIRFIPQLNFTDPNELRHAATLVIGGEKIHVSKEFLSIHSPVFNSMFYGESADHMNEEIELKDIDREEFLEMLRVIYPSDHKVTDDNVRSLLNLGDRFKITVLVDLVEDHLIASTKIQLPSKLLLADQFKLARLQKQCHAQIKAMEMEDKCRSSDGIAAGFIRFEISDVSTITPAGIYSPVTEVLGTPWTILVLKKDSFLGVFLSHRKCGSNIWSIDVSYEFSLINIGGKGGPINKKFKTTYNAQNSDPHGHAKFVSWNDLINEEKGFIEGDKIVIEARFTLSNTMGIRIAPRIDFSDSDDPRNDITLIVDGERIHVNKGILAIHSPFFNAMFHGDFVEKNKNEIELKDIDREEFIRMLNMLYPSYEKITDANAESLLKMADRFEIKTIVDQAEKFLIDSSTMSILSRLKLSDQYRLVMLQDHCLDSFKTVQEIFDLKTTDVYKNLSDKASRSLLDRAMMLG